MNRQELIAVQAKLIGKLDKLLGDRFKVDHPDDTSCASSLVGSIRALSEAISVSVETYHKDLRGCEK